MQICGLINGCSPAEKAAKLDDPFIYDWGCRVGNAWANNDMSQMDAFQGELLTAAHFVTSVCLDTEDNNLLQMAGPRSRRTCNSPTPSAQNLCRSCQARFRRRGIELRIQADPTKSSRLMLFITSW